MVVGNERPVTGGVGGPCAVVGPFLSVSERLTSAQSACKLFTKPIIQVTDVINDKQLLSFVFDDEPPAAPNLQIGTRSAARSASLLRLLLL